MTGITSISEFFVCADRQPDAPALSDSNGTEITYGNLARDIKSLSVYLIENGVSDGSKVALLQPKSVWSAVFILATLHAGGTIIPIDTGLPGAKIQRILNDLSPDFIIADDTIISVKFSFAKKHSIPVKSERPAFLFKCAAQNREAGLFAYILYTSGSTGEPKGVCISRSALNAFTEWTGKHFRLTQADKVASIAPFHFDLSLFDLFATLQNGASLCIFSSEEARNPRLMNQLLSALKVTTIYATPSFYMTLVQFGKMEKYSWTSLRLILFAGEIFPVKHLHLLMNRLGRARFFNLYGPTETNVCTWHEIATIEEERTVPYPIGTVCEHLQYEIADDGELLIGGAQVAECYLNRPELSEEKFYRRGEVMWFRTGDIVKKDPSGLLVYSGRKDRMIKRRGYRIEPAEIEQALLLLPYVLEAAVISTKNTDDEVTLTAILHASEEPDLPEIKLQLLSSIAEYMLPDRVIRVESFPKTSSGKIDYETLINSISHRIH